MVKFVTMLSAEILIMRELTEDGHKNAVCCLNIKSI